VYCPKCSQPQVSDEVQFCSRCGLPLLNLKEMISTAAKTMLKTSNKDAELLSSRQKGMRQGVMLILLSVILIPAHILLAALFPANDRLIESSVSDTPFEKISQALLLTIFMLGLARLLYARFFQAAAVAENTSPSQLEASPNYLLSSAPGTRIGGVGRWRQDTGEIVKSREQR
jgi:hypothetical protein